MLKQEYAKVSDVEEAHKLRDDVRDHEDRLWEAQNSLKKSFDAVTTLRQKASRKFKAQKTMEKRKEAFTAANKSGTGVLTSGDVTAFAKTQYQFELNDEASAAIVAALEPITIEKFRRMWGMVAIKRSEANRRDTCEPVGATVDE